MLLVLVSGQLGDAQSGLGERVQPVGGNRRPHPRERPPHQPQVQLADSRLRGRLLLGRGLLGEDILYQFK